MNTCTNWIKLIKLVCFFLHNSTMFYLQIEIYQNKYHNSCANSTAIPHTFTCNFPLYTNLCVTYVSKVMTNLQNHKKTWKLSNVLRNVWLPVEPVASHAYLWLVYVEWQNTY